MPIFNDQENRPPYVEDGDYVLRVIGFEIGMSNGERTRGSEKYTINFEVEGKGTEIYDYLIDNPKTSWRIDTFLKSCGIKLPKGTEFTFNQEEAKSKNIQWIDLLGLRCHAKVYIDKYIGGDGKEYKTNKIALYYTDKPALPPDKTGIETDDDITF